MIRRLLYITFITILVGALAYFYIQVNEHSDSSVEVDLMEILPNNAGVIVEIPNLSAIAENKNLDSEMWKALAEIKPLGDYSVLWSQWDSLSSTNQELKSWSNTPAILSYHHIGKSPQAFRAIKFGSKAYDKAWQEALSNQFTIEKEYNKVSIYKANATPAEYYFYHKGYLASSPSVILLEQSIRHFQSNNNIDESLEELKKTKGDGANANIYVNYEAIKRMIADADSPKSPFYKRLNKLGNWGEFDFSVEASNVILNGFSNYNENDYWHIFKGQEAIKMSIHDAIPTDSKGFVSLSIGDIANFRTDYEQYLKNNEQYTSYEQWLQSTEAKGSKTLPSLIDGLVENEIALCHDDHKTSQTNEALLIIKSPGASEAKSILNGILERYAAKQGVDVNSLNKEVSLDSEATFTFYNFPYPSAFKQLYGDVFSSLNAKYFCYYDNYLFFSADQYVLKKVVMANILNQTLANDPQFVDIYTSFSAKNSIFFYGLSSNLIPVLQKGLGKDICQKNNINSEKLNDFHALTYQMVSSSNYAYNSILLNYNPNLKDRPQTVWSSKLDAAPVGKPTFVKNHKTNEMEICIQDELNNLYLISNSGRIIWKKPLAEPILSEIYQIDYYKNNKLQLLFNTESKIWLLDRNGNHTERYPILLPAKASTGLSLFDYENSRNYRIFVPTIDKKLYLYGKDGNINNGFDFKGAETPLTRPIQHFRVKGKDYIVFSDQNRVYILNRKGKERVKIKEQFAASPNNSFLLMEDSKPYLLNSDENGSAIKIFFDGNVEIVSLPKASATHYFAADELVAKGSTNYIVVDKDELMVYDSKGKVLYSKQIDEGLLSRPYFYKFAANVTKIGFVDTNNNMIHLINGADGKAYKDFPLVGTTPFSIGFLNSSAWRFNLIVGGENTSLYNYKVK